MPLPGYHNGGLFYSLKIFKSVSSFYTAATCYRVLLRNSACLVLSPRPDVRVQYCWQLDLYCFCQVHQNTRRKGMPMVDFTLQDKSSTPLEFPKSRNPGCAFQGETVSCLRSWLPQKPCESQWCLRFFFSSDSSRTELPKCTYLNVFMAGHGPTVFLLPVAYQMGKLRAIIPAKDTNICRKCQYLCGCEWSPSSFGKLFLLACLQEWASIMLWNPYSFGEENALGRVPRAPNGTQVYGTMLCQNSIVVLIRESNLFFASRTYPVKFSLLQENQAFVHLSKQSTAWEHLSDDIRCDAGVNDSRIRDHSPEASLWYSPRKWPTKKEINPVSVIRWWWMTMKANDCDFLFEKHTEKFLSRVRSFANWIRNEAVMSQTVSNAKGDEAQ